MHTLYAFVTQLILTGVWLEHFNNVTDENGLETTCYATCYSMRCPGFTLFPNGTCVAFGRILGAIDSRWVYSWIHVQSPDDSDNCAVYMPQYVKKSLEQQNGLGSEQMISTNQKYATYQKSNSRITDRANHSLIIVTKESEQEKAETVHNSYSSLAKEFILRDRTTSRARRATHGHWETTVNATSAVDAAKFISMIVAISNAVKVKNLNASSTTSFEAPAAASHAKDSPSKAVMSAIKSFLGVTLTSDSSRTAISGNVITAEAMKTWNDPTASPSVTSKTELDADIIADKTNTRSASLVRSDYLRTNSKKVEEAISSTSATQNTSFVTKIVPKTMNPELTSTKSSVKQASATRRIKSAMNVSDDDDEPYVAMSPLLEMVNQREG